MYRKPYKLPSRFERKMKLFRYWLMQFGQGKVIAALFVLLSIYYMVWDKVFNR